MKFSKKEMMNAFFLYLDESLPTFNCSKIEKIGNSSCFRCDLCMMKQYLVRIKNGESPKIAKEDSGSSHPTID